MGSSSSCTSRGAPFFCGTTTGTNGPLNLWTLFAKQNEIIGSYGGNRAELARVLQLAADGRISPVIDSVLTLDEVATAQERLKARQQRGKIVIAFDAA